MCIWDLQCFETFRNCCLFCTFWHIRNFYCGEAHHANYSKHSLNHHFQHCAQCVYEIYSIFKVFEIAVCFAHFVVFEIWTPLAILPYYDTTILNYHSKRCSNHHFQHCAQSVYEIYSVFKVFEMAVCFAHIGLFEIWTAHILTMLAMVNVVQIIISDIAHSV